MLISQSLLNPCISPFVLVYWENWASRFFGYLHAIFMHPVLSRHTVQTFKTTVSIVVGCWYGYLSMAQLMPLPLTVSCFSKIQIGFTFLVPAHPGSPGKRAVKRVSVSQHFVQSHDTAKNTNFLRSVNHYLDCCTDKTITKQILTQSTHLRVQLWLPGTISLLTLELMAEANFL